VNFPHSSGSKFNNFVTTKSQSGPSNPASEKSDPFYRGTSAQMTRSEVGPNPSLQIQVREGFQPEDENFSQSRVTRSFSKCKNLRKRATKSKSQSSRENSESSADDFDKSDALEQEHFEMFELPVPMICDDTSQNSQARETNVSGGKYLRNILCLSILYGMLLSVP